MALQNCGLNLNREKKELQPHGIAAFPCAGYESEHGDQLQDLIPWHWHEEIEVVYIVKGLMDLQIPAKHIALQEGEVAVINGNILHAAIGNPYCHLQSLVFSPLLICGTRESVFYTKYIQPLISCNHFDCVIFQKEDKTVIDHFIAAFQAMKNDPFAYEFTVRGHMSSVLLEAYQREEAYLQRPKAAQNTDGDRITRMICFVQEHYTQQLTLDAIADAASISEREAQRCFKKTIGESPIQYLLKYRLIQSADLLLRFPMRNISEIAEACGFESPAYYAKKFKELYLRTPKEYRNGEITGKVTAANDPLTLA